MTLDYKTALALRNAGYPPSMESRALFIDSTEVIAPRGSLEDLLDDFAYLPSLEELIVACGSNFEALYLRKRNEQRWTAEGYIYNVSGSIPTEAVARLYLALHSKE